MREPILYIDGLFYKGAGLGRYYELITKEFLKRGIKIYTCVPKSLERYFEEDFKDYKHILEPVFVDYEKFSVKGFFNQGKILKKLEDKVDIFLYPQINLPYYIPKNTISVIFDLIPLTKYWRGSPLKTRAYLFYLKRALTYSKGIITSSDFVKKELTSMFELNKVKTIYAFIDDKFSKNQYTKPILKEDYILFVGNRKKHKNLKNLILAFNMIKEKNLKLVIAGSYDKSKYDEAKQTIKTLGIEDKVVEIERPSDEELISLYQHAKLFILPSLYEGFGLTLLEAISCGSVSISSNIEVLREIFGSSIACFDPFDTMDIAKKIDITLNNEEIRKKILGDAKSISIKYRKDAIIEEYLSYFHKVCCR